VLFIKIFSSVQLAERFNLNRFVVYKNIRQSCRRCDLGDLIFGEPFIKIFDTPAGKESWINPQV
jgi:hypothetical protein